MKAERRHDLKTNTLATTIVELPNFWKTHGTKVLVTLVAAVAIALLVQYRMNAKTQAAAQALENLATARNHLATLDNPRLLTLPPADAMRQIRASSELANSAITAVLDLSTDAKIRAEALVSRGDLNLLLAQLPVLPGAATQPALQKPSTNEVYLKQAQEAYQQVLSNNQYLEHRTAAVTAHFGLAAIEEDRGNWREAAGHYETIKDDKTAPDVIRSLAAMRLTSNLQAGTTQPAAPVAMLPATLPATAPTSQP